MSESKGKDPGKPFFETLPGIITAIATLVTAIGGCIAIVLATPLGNKLFPATPVPGVSSSVPDTTGALVPNNQPSSQNPVPPTAIPPSPTPNIPRAHDFQACSALCNGQNSATVFSGGRTKIYAQFNYENFPPGAKYLRTWSNNGKEWIRYSCSWDGPASGTEVLSLKEPKGLHSGTWEFTVLVNDAVVLKEQITLNGNWVYWDPAGTINACHGTVD